MGLRESTPRVLMNLKRLCLGLGRAGADLVR